METFDGLKLFHKAVEGLKEDKKFDVTIVGICKFKLACKRAAKKYNWGPQVTAIEHKGEKYNLFRQHTKLTLEALTNDAKAIREVTAADIITETTFTDALTPKRIKSVILSTWVRNSLTTTGDSRLNLHKLEFHFYYSDGIIKEHGPSLLYVLFSKLNPLTCVKVQTGCHLPSQFNAVTVRQN